MKTRELASILAGALQPKKSSQDAPSRESAQARAREAAEDFFVGRDVCPEKLASLWEKATRAAGIGTHDEAVSAALDTFCQVVPHAGQWRPRRPVGERPQIFSVAGPLAEERGWSLTMTAAAMPPFGLPDLALDGRGDKTPIYVRLHQFITDACRNAPHEGRLALFDLVQAATGSEPRSGPEQLFARPSAVESGRLPLDAWGLPPHEREDDQRPPARSQQSDTSVSTTIQAESQQCRVLFTELRHWLLSCGARDVKVYARLAEDEAEDMLTMAAQPAPHARVWMSAVDFELDMIMPPAYMRQLLPLQLSTLRHMKFEELTYRI